MCEAHGPVVQTVGVQDKLLRSPRSIAKSSCTSRSLGDVASSSGKRLARQQKRSAGLFDLTSHADFGAAINPAVGGGTHRRRATTPNNGD